MRISSDWAAGVHEADPTYCDHLRFTAKYANEICAKLAATMHPKIVDDFISTIVECNGNWPALINCWNSLLINRTRSYNTLTFTSKPTNMLHWTEAPAQVHFAIIIL